MAKTTKIRLKTRIILSAMMILWMQFSKDFILRREHLPGMVILSKCVVHYHCSQNLPGQQELWTWFCSLCLNLILMALTWHCGGSMHTTSHCFFVFISFCVDSKREKNPKMNKATETHVQTHFADVGLTSTTCPLWRRR